MAFLQNGSWVPDQPLTYNAPNAQAQPMMALEGGPPQVAQQQTRMQNMPQAQMNFSMPTPGVSMMPMNLGMTPQNQAPMSNMQTQMPLQAQGAANNLSAERFAPTQPGGNQGGGGNMTPPPNATQTMQPARSVMQSVNNASPQSIQNFLQALQQNPQVSQGNAWQNPQGMQGQGPQAGFQGFQQNGSPERFAPTYQPTNWQPSQANQNNAYQNLQYQPPKNANPYGNLQYNPPPKLSENTNQSGHPYQGGQLQYQPPKTNAYPENTNQGHANNNTRQLGAQMSNQPNAQPYAMMAASDVQLKQEIQPGQYELQDFLNSLGVHSYEYTDPKYGEGRRISPMAQEIEQTSLGQAAISTNAEGYKMVDYGKLGGTMLASLALLNHKYNELESKLIEGVKAGLKAKMATRKEK